MPQYADQLWMFINGVPYEIASVDMNVGFGKRTAVKTMNPTGRPLGTREEIGETTFNIEAPVRMGMPKWTLIRDAQIVFVQRVEGTPMCTAVNAFYTDHKFKTGENGEQMVTVNFGCLDWIEGA